LGRATLFSEAAVDVLDEEPVPQPAAVWPKPHPMGEPELELQDKPQAPKPGQEVKAKASAKAHKAGKR